MGRGGGTVAGSKHSVEKEEHHSSGGGGGKADPKMMGVIFLILAVIFLILVIAVPIAMVASPAGDSCIKGESLNRNEQVLCVPDDYDQTWVAEYEAAGAKYAKVYKYANATVKYTYRNYTWYNYYAKLKGSYDYFEFSVPFYITGRLAVYCDGKKCDDLKLYLLSSKEFNEAVDSNGEFHEKTHKPDFKDFDDEQWNYFTYQAPGPDYYYLLFSNKKSKSVEILYSISMYNKIIDTDGMTPATPKENKCEFKDMKKGEYLIMEYVSPTNASYAGDTSQGPEYFGIKMHNLRISWGGVVAVIIIFGLLIIACAILGVYYLILKH